MMGVGGDGVLGSVVLSGGDTYAPDHSTEKDYISIQNSMAIASRF